MKSWQRILFMVVLVAAAVGVSRAPAIKHSSKPTCQLQAAQLLTIINDERAKHAIPALVEDNELVSSANNKLQDMITHTYIGNDSVDGTSEEKFITSAGVHAVWGSDIVDNAVTTQRAWATFQASKPHYDSLMSSGYTRVGVAAACTDYMVKTATGPNANNAIVGHHITQLTVVHLAAPEPK